MGTDGERKLPKGIYKRGRIYWICYSVGGGKMKHESTGGARLDNAENLLATRKDERFRATKYPELVRSEKTIGEVISHYRRHVGSADSAHQIGQRLDDALNFLGADTRVEAITFEMLDSWWADLVKRRSIQPQSLRHYLGALRAAFRYARRSRLTDANPMTDYELPKGKKKRKRVASQAELSRILAYLTGHEKPDYSIAMRTAVALAVETGMRRAELSALKRSWIDLSNRIIRIPQEVTKSEEGRPVPLTRAALEILEGRHDPIVDLDPDKITDRFRRTIENLEIQDLHFHDLRHTRATSWVKAGVPEAVVQEILGHESVEMTRHYTNLTEIDLQEAIARLDTLH